VAGSISKLKPFRGVYGNIDGAEIRSLYPENNVFFCEEVKVLITHIGGYPEKYPSGITDLLRTEKPELFICGHSHILKVMYDRTFKLLHINPGAAGVHGFHHVKTAVRFQIEGAEIKNLEVIELGKRTG
jgi:predicted phosphodiesterase